MEPFNPLEKRWAKLGFLIQLEPASTALDLATRSGLPACCCCYRLPTANERLRDQDELAGGTFPLWLLEDHGRVI